MRYTVRDVARDLSRAGAWWEELPARRHVRRVAWWRWLLFESGQGWLTWKLATTETAGSYLEPPEPYTVAPPLRRVSMALRYRSMWPLGMRDDDRKRHAAW